jgi:hypothetical protein
MQRQSWFMQERFVAIVVEQTQSQAERLRRRRVDTVRTLRKTTEECRIRKASGVGSQFNVKRVTRKVNTLPRAVLDVSIRCPGSIGSSRWE